MNKVYFTIIYDKDTEFDSYMIVSTNVVMKNNYIKLLYNKMFACEKYITIEVKDAGESELKCGVYTKEGLKMIEDESDLALDIW